MADVPAMLPALGGSAAPPPGAKIALAGGAPAIGNTKRVALFTDEQYLSVFKRFKREAFADRWIFERQWTKVYNYKNNRQWLAPYSRTEGWRDARLAKGIPKPVTNKCKEVDQALRAMFASIRFGTIIRPVSENTAAITTAATCDDMMPLLHDLHEMDAVMNEFDESFVNLGTGILHSYWDYAADPTPIDAAPMEKCRACGKVSSSAEIVAAKQACPQCGARQFDRVDTPSKPKGKARTLALSPLEVAFPFQYQRWAQVPGLIRMRFPDRREYEEDAELAKYVPTIRWSKTASDRSLQIYKALPYQNDIPTSRSQTLGYGGSESEGTPEFELWMRPTPEHPEGLVMRVAGDGDSPILLHLEDGQGTPGPLPYHDVKGNPLFTFSLGAYQTVAGRILGSGVHDSVMSKYDALNRLDSLTEMIVMRMASPQWVVPKGADVAWLGDSPGMPGLLLEWNSQMAGPNGEPKRVPGIGPDASLMQLRKMLLADIDEGTGMYEILRGGKPPAVDSFSGMQLLLEAGMRRFSSAFQSRGNVYRDWAMFALELQREFGRDDMTLAVMGGARSWAFKQFKQADLSGDVIIIIEDGTYTPKTSLGERAAIEHLNAMNLIDRNDPDQKFAIYQKFGQTSLAPGLNRHFQAAQKKQQDFVKWIVTGGPAKLAPPDATTGQVQMPTNYPLLWRPWYDAQIHRTEFLKFCNSDVVQQMLADPKLAAVAGLLTAHLKEMDLAIQERATGNLDPGGLADVPAEPAAAPPPVGAAAAMRNSNQNSAPLNQGLRLGIGGPPADVQIHTAAPA